MGAAEAAPIHFVNMFGGYHVPTCRDHLYGHRDDHLCDHHLCDHPVYHHKYFFGNIYKGTWYSFPFYDMILNKLHDLIINIKNLLNIKI